MKARMAAAARAPIVCALASIALLTPAAASAAPAPFGNACTPQNGVLFCPTPAGGPYFPSWDGTPLDVNVTLPATGAGPFPTIVMLHGLGGSKTDFEASSPQGSAPLTFDYNNVYYASRGYAVVNYSSRGFGASCGPVNSAAAACSKGWLHLADQRYEARDTQYLLGLLVNEGVTSPTAIGVTGISYGGGQALELAYLRNRVRCAGEPAAAGDPCGGLPVGAMVPWDSSLGIPLSIDAVFARWPWSDLISSLAPNGRFINDDLATANLGAAPIGIEQSNVEGLYALLSLTGNVAPAGVDPTADLTDWKHVLDAGEPYGAAAQAVAKEIQTYHQAFGIPGTPAPILIQSGWDDDLFPPFNALRIYDTLRAANPQAPVYLQLGDLGHARGANKLAEYQTFNAAGGAMFDAYLKGAGVPPAPGSVQAFGQTCPSGVTAGTTAAPPSGPFSASSFDALAPHIASFGSTAAQIVTSSGGDPLLGGGFDPVSTSDPCKTAGDAPASGEAVYRFASPGFTMLGLPTVTATIVTAGTGGQLDSRLWDVTPGGTETLVTRGAYRLLDDQQGQITFQLNGNGYTFPRGDTVKLELLGNDSTYLRASNGSFTVQVSGVRVTLPITAPLPVTRAPRGRIVVSVSPKRVRAGSLVRFRFVVKLRPAGGGKQKAVAKATVRFAGHKARTNSGGVAFIRVRLHRRGLFAANASDGYDFAGVVRVRVLKRR